MGIIFALILDDKDKVAYGMSPGEVVFECGRRKSLEGGHALMVYSYRMKSDDGD